MDENSSLIYGLELQARALTPQYGEGNEVRFLLATNSLKPTPSNQIHLVEYNEEQSNIKSKIYEHAPGEVWKINSCPHDAHLLSTCYSVQKGTQVQTHAALFTLPDAEEEERNSSENIKSEFLPWGHTEILETEQFGERVKTVEFHPMHKNTLGCVVDGKIVIFQRDEPKTRIIAEMSSTSGGGKSTVHTFTGGRWSHHHQGNQFIALHDCNVRSYDIRDTQHCAWSIEDAHGQLIRDVDCNPNKQCHIVTGGDDGYLKIWDCRMPKEPVFSRNDHSHWIWSVRFNTFHDQLILSSSSDCKVLLTCAGSVSSDAGLDDAINDKQKNNKARTAAPTTGETERRRIFLGDGLLQTYDQHEDSVYCVEWSNVDPWIFASLSYDGRLLISKVPKQYKYQLIL